MKSEYEKYMEQMKRIADTNFYIGRWTSDPGPWKQRLMNAWAVFRGRAVVIYVKS